MLVYMIRRAGQSILVLLVMAVLVFIGVYAIGNPIDIMIVPTPIRRRSPPRPSAWASTSRSTSSS